ncbi:hypothetical protein T03_8979 [Trichinella britovi]|uniref:Uncharacterized protein n=1 Tax=Trichinella britovi TaxID=45882 RepID=A0A0V1CE35_TRIBR|nr:hypothetical protein T03_8979 [Trichinella britovi]
MAQILQNVHTDISNVINDESRFVEKLLGKIEQKTGRIRDEIAVMSAIQIFISLFASSGAELLVELLCLAYPAVKILTGLESIEKVNCMQWMFSSVTFGLP